jgi:uncharacterized membrane protein
MDKIAEKLAKWFGSTPFITFHIIWFSVWIALHILTEFDKDWENLTIVVSLEAIFLSLFILRAENVQSSRFEEKVKEDLKQSKEELKILKSIKNKK